MALTDLDGVIGQVVVDNVGDVLGFGEEAEDLAIVVEELLLASHLATTETLLHEVTHFRVTVGNAGLLGSGEVVVLQIDRGRQGSSLLLYKAFEN